jgi:hypothetical protein
VGRQIERALANHAGRAAETSRRGIVVPVGLVGLDRQEELARLNDARVEAEAAEALGEGRAVQPRFGIGGQEVDELDQERGPCLAA